MFLLYFLSIITKFWMGDIFFHDMGILWRSDCRKLGKPTFQNYFNMTSSKQRAIWNYTSTSVRSRGMRTANCPSQHIKSLKFFIWKIHFDKTIWANQRILLFENHFDSFMCRGGQLAMLLPIHINPCIHHTLLNQISASKNAWSKLFQYKVVHRTEFWSSSSRKLLSLSR